ncbi:MAG: type IX secretion system membrane protein PorP/SprF [Bacteroidia bacterium]|nr:type IX secretion system membrane protein PorP/SprF [Bacteroidia bacterium]
MKFRLPYYQKLILGIFLAAMLFMPKRGICQQDPVFNQYMNNLLTIQPAYAGLSGYVNVTAMSRIQWAGFDGAPTTNTFTVQGPIKKYNVGIGLSIINDKFGQVVRQNGFYGDYAYRILLDNDQYISFGLKAGINIYEALFSELTTHDPNDPVAMFDIAKKYLPNFGAGFLWHSDDFFLGASVPKFFKNGVNSPSGVSVYHEEVNYYVMGGVVLPITDNMRFKPTFLYRYSQLTPKITDLTANFLFYDRVWVGATYRLQNSYGFLFQIFLNPQLKLGYAYDLTTFHSTQVNAGTHEFMITYDFPTTRKRFNRFTPRYF